MVGRGRVDQRECLGGPRSVLLLCRDLVQMRSLRHSWRAVSQEPAAVRRLRTPARLLARMATEYPGVGGISLSPRS